MGDYNSLATVAYWGQPAGDILQSALIDPGNLFDESEDYLLSTFLNLESEESVWGHQTLDQNGNTTAAVTSHDSHPENVVNVESNEEIYLPEISAPNLPVDKQSEPKTQAKMKAHKIDTEIWERMFSIISDLHSSNELDEMLRILPEKHSFNPRQVVSP